MQLNKLIQTYAKKFSDAGISEGQKEIRYLVEESINISMIEQLYGDIILKELQKKKVINLLKTLVKILVSRNYCYIMFNSS